MRVAVVISAMGAGGAERVVSLLTSFWMVRGWDIVIISFEPEGAFTYHPIDPRVRQLQLGIDSGGSLWMAAWRVVRRLRALRKCLVRQKPDLVISFLTKINVLTILASIGLQIPVIISERNNPQRQAMNPLWRCCRPRTTGHGHGFSWAAMNSRGER